jgi:hypothetical protein
MSTHVAIPSEFSLTTRRSVVALVLVLFQLNNAGCATAIGTQLLPRQVVIADSRASQVMTIHSEPEGARIVQDGVLLGTTPVALDLAYHRETRVRRRRFCWLQFPFGLIDAGTGVLGVYGIAEQRPWPDDKKGYYIAGLILAPLYALVGSGLATINLASACEEDSEHVDVPHDHHLQLKAATWEEPLQVRVPTDSKSASVVVRELEAFDWDRAKALDSIAAYRGYLDKYPTGRWRREAEPRLDQLAWQRASQADTVTSYWQYLSDIPKGKWQDQAEAAIAKIFGREPSQVSEGTLSDLMLSEQSGHRVLALGELVRRHAAQHVIDLLASAKTPSSRRWVLVTTLGQLADAAAPPEHRAFAREILCTFATGQQVPVSADSCKAYRETKYIPIEIGPHYGATLCSPIPGGNPWRDRECRTYSSGPRPVEEQMAAFHAAAKECETKAIEALRQLQQVAAKAGECGPE